MSMQEEVIAALRGGKVQEALGMARSLTEGAPHESLSHRLLAVAQAAAGDLVSAHASLDRALELAPDDAGIHYQRATLFVGEQQPHATRLALDRTVDFDPNEVRAYLLRAQLSLWDRDIAAAEQELKLAARLDPEHPGVLTLNGIILLQRDRIEDASTLLSRAVRRAPHNPQARYALGLALLAQGHFAFAEQAFRSVLAQVPDLHAARRLLADSLRRQGRLAEAAVALTAATDKPPPVGMLREAARLWVDAGEPKRAIELLKRASELSPKDRRILDELIAALRIGGDVVYSREAIESALLAAPEIDGLWSARLSFEPPDGDLQGIADRWLLAIPASVPAMQLQMWLAQRDGRNDHAWRLATRILSIDPKHFEANVAKIHELYLMDADAAVAHIGTLLSMTSDERTRRMLLGWRGRALDKAGRYADAVLDWETVQMTANPGVAELPRPSAALLELEPADADSEASLAGPLFVYGPPGSGVERVVGTLYRSVENRLRMDRMESLPPSDLLQSAETAVRLEGGELSAAEVAESWRRALPARRADEAAIIDWLPWWDRALIPVLRQNLPGAKLLLVLADPRDMLLDWLQRGTYIPYRISSQLEAATWLADLAKQIASLIEQNSVRHVVLRVDESAHDAEALAQQLAPTVGTRLAPLRFLGPERFPAGHWRRYAEVLAGPFAQLTPVAMRLGYPET